MIEEAKIEDLIVELRMSQEDARRIQRYLRDEGVELLYSAEGIIWRRTKS